MKFCIVSLYLMIVCVFLSCDEPIYTPKPRSYPKVEYPTKDYVAFEEAYCPFGFEMPKYVVVSQDTNFFDQKPSNPCWFNLDIPSLNSRMYFSYAMPGEQKSFDELRDDAYTLANKHTVKASFIDEYPVQTPSDVEGVVFDFEGPAASPFQFFLTDSLNRHFFRGSLYFNNKVQPDSMAPIYDFVKKDMIHLINTFVWKE